MQFSKSLMLFFLAIGFCSETYGGVIVEELEPPSQPGNAYIGTFRITPSAHTWAFGVGNSAIEDTSISGISFIDGLKARDHWISALISRASWDSGFDFDSIRPIGATAPSSFSFDTSMAGWQWGSTDYVAFYWLSEAGNDATNPLAVLQPGSEYDAFKFFTSAPNSPFAIFTAPDGSELETGETIIEGDNMVPEPTSIAVWACLGYAGFVAGRRRRR